MFLHVSCLRQAPLTLKVTLLHPPSRPWRPHSKFFASSMIVTGCGGTGVEAGCGPHWLRLHEAVAAPCARLCQRPSDRNKNENHNHHIRNGNATRTSQQQRTPIIEADGATRHNRTPATNKHQIHPKHFESTNININQPSTNMQTSP